MSNPIRRITVAEVQEAYRKTGLRPTRGEFRLLEGELCDQLVGGCAVTAIALASGWNPDDSIILWESSNFDRNYSIDFRYAFDGYESDRDSLGYQDGLAVAKAVFPNGGE